MLQLKSLTENTIVYHKWRISVWLLMHSCIYHFTRYTCLDGREPALALWVLFCDWWNFPCQKRPIRKWGTLIWQLDFWRKLRECSGDDLTLFQSVSVNWPMKWDIQRSLQFGMNFDIDFDWPEILKGEGVSTSREHLLREEVLKCSA